MNDPILYTVENGIGTLRVNRPQARNALNWAAQEQFAEVVTRAAGDEGLRALIVTGAGSTFVSGGDLKELAAEPGAATGERLNGLMSSALAHMARLPLPVIAAVNGHAVGGGCEILTACDLRLAAPSATLAFVQVRMGLTTGWGGAARLVQLIGQSRALEILLRGRSLSAQEAQEIGFIHHVVQPGVDVVARAQTWAEELVDLPPEALAALKQLVRETPALSGRDALALERRLFTELWGRPHHLEAMAAFLEKRAPRFDRRPSSGP
jgi:enoyl-CoA hydratase